MEPDSVFELTTDNFPKLGFGKGAKVTPRLKADGNLELGTCEPERVRCVLVSDPEGAALFLAPDQIQEVAA